MERTSDRIYKKTKELKIEKQIIGSSTALWEISQNIVEGTAPWKREKTLLLS
jgi:hypothetical protein